MKIGKTVVTNETETYETGAKKSSELGKGRFDLIWPDFLFRLAKRLEEGSLIYGDWNWAQGMPLSRFYSSAMRHLIQVGQGLDDEDHLAAVAFNVMCLMYGIQKTQEGIWPEEYNDLPFRFDKF